MAVYDWREFEDLDLPGASSSSRGHHRRRCVGEPRRSGPRPTRPGQHAGRRRYTRPGVRSFVPACTRARLRLESAQRFGQGRAGGVPRWASKYWLDIHDPALSFATRAHLPLQIKALLIAAIIEMGYSTARTSSQFRRREACTRAGYRTSSAASSSAYPYPGSRRAGSKRASRPTQSIRMQSAGSLFHI